MSRWGRRASLVYLVACALALFMLLNAAIVRGIAARSERDLHGARDRRS